jgi:uncharacterized membrane protein YtjA (UPF0391 family)
VEKMLGLVLTFLLIAIIAGILGFGIIAGTAALLAKVLFIIFLISFVISLREEVKCNGEIYRPASDEAIHARAISRTSECAQR